MRLNNAKTSPVTTQAHYVIYVGQKCKFRHKIDFGTAFLNDELVFVDKNTRASKRGQKEGHPEERIESRGVANLKSAQNPIEEAKSREGANGKGISPGMDRKEESSSDGGRG